MRFSWLLDPFLDYHVARNFFVRSTEVFGRHARVNFDALAFIGTLREKKRVIYLVNLRTEDSLVSTMCSAVQGEVYVQRESIFVFGI